MHTCSPLATILQLAVGMSGYSYSWQPMVGDDCDACKHLRWKVRPLLVLKGFLHVAALHHTHDQAKHEP